MHLWFESVKKLTEKPVWFSGAEFNKEVILRRFRKALWYLGKAILAVRAQTAYTGQYENSVKEELNELTQSKTTSISRFMAIKKRHSQLTGKSLIYTEE